MLIVSYCSGSHEGHRNVRIKSIKLYGLIITCISVGIALHNYVILRLVPFSCGLS